MDNAPIIQRTPSEWKVDPSLQSIIYKLIENDPAAYRLAQNFGNFIMSSKFANVDTLKVSQEDETGDAILYNKLINDIKFYGLTEEDFTEKEKMILEKFMGKDWSNQITELK